MYHRRFAVDVPDDRVAPHRPHCCSLEEVTHKIKHKHASDLQKEGTNQNLKNVYLLEYRYFSFENINSTILGLTTNSIILGSTIVITLDINLNILAFSEI